ncbi:MAG: hypothetical protein H0X65_05700, partial [Gemmatimonadetes bacterium]|nr:hypothetical protein [Gemmatimonadota bacterium]
MIELRTLGSLDLRVPGGGEVRSVLAQPKRLALLAYLAIDAPDGFARRDTLLGMFWPESDDEHARGAFRQSVRYLRRSLGEGVLVNRAEEELGIAEGALWCDAAEFRRAAGAGEAGRALELYRGDLLDGFCVAGAPEFERWLEAERSALRAKAAAAAWTLAGTAEAAGDAASACEWARRAVGLAPLDEGGVRRRIALLDRSGDRAGAMSAYEEFARHLAAELELEPAPETRALAEDIRCRDAAVQLPVRPLGERKPKDEGHVVAVGAPASSPPPSARSRVAGRLAVVSAVVVLALTGLAYLALPRTGEPPLNPRRVVVAPFENRTGDPALDPVASMTADWIIQGLSGRGALEVVPVTAALTSARYLSVAGSPAAAERDPRPLARETGAGTAVSGSYYRQGDSLHFQARITDAASGRLLAAIGSEAAAVETPLDG